jgi:serine/threonine protein kinase
VPRGHGRESQVTDDPGARSVQARATGTQGTLLPGSTVAGYVIEEQIGAGGMAVVYRARDDTLGRLVAIKVLSPALAADEEFRTRFLRESRAVAAVDEPHIVPVYGAGEAAGVLYIAARFVAGGDLSLLQRAAGGPLPSAQVAELITQVAGALDAAHAVGLVHRDVKPGNILVERIPGRPEFAYLSDFGLSKWTTEGASGLTVDGRFMGTPDYCAPEQIAGRTVDGRTDQYSLACVGFTLLAGVVPFRRGDALARLYAHVNSLVPALTAIRPELPAAVDAVVARGMAKNPAERYESCAAFARALRGALGVGADASQGGVTQPHAQEPVTAPRELGYQQTITAGGWHPSVPPGSPGRALQAPGRRQRPLYKNRSLIFGGSVAAVVAAAGVIVGVMLSSQHGGTGGSLGSNASAGGTTGTATLVGSFPVPGGNLKSGAFLSADGNYVAAASGKAGVYIFSTVTRRLVKTVSLGARDMAAPVSFSPDDKTLYVIDVTAGKMYDLNVATGKPVHAYPLPGGSYLAWTLGSDVVVATDASGTDAEYDMATGKLYARVPNPSSAQVDAVYTDRSGTYILISDKNGVAYLVDAPSKKVVATFPFHPGVGNVYPQISLDGNTVYLPGDGTAAAKLWDRTTKSYVTPTGARWPALDSGVTFSTDSKFALTSPTTASEVMDIWDIATGALVGTVTVPESPDEELMGVGPGGSELLSTGSVDIDKGIFSKLNIWAIPA